MGGSTSKPMSPIVQQDEIAANIDPDTMAQLRELFTELAAQRGSQDTIDKETYLKHFQSKDIKGEALFQFERMFDVMDYKGTGKLDFEEFLSSMYIINTDGNSAHKMEMLFRLYDANGDGYISKQEATKVAKSMTTLSQVSALSMMGVDPSIMNMVKKELKKHSKAIKQAVAATVDAMFDRLDTNQDGKISFDEWMAQIDSTDPVVEMWLKSMQPAGSGHVISKDNVEHLLEANMAQMGEGDCPVQ